MYSKESLTSYEFYTIHTLKLFLTWVWIHITNQYDPRDINRNHESTYGLWLWNILLNACTLTGWWKGSIRLKPHHQSISPIRSVWLVPKL